ncbi:hypothetical protein K458DRAFT_109773 [Lentithecium fluviatile CBS 122367]|uniref:Uncharacterized protein n=1 Tax=Lentithecium fluviatile CBS 122367 TaxID=1168545 RepID=A0A6G1IQ18_9PLEO|nr:hypothetical protein K458DRAFT_109773 [Lentithecium fluviatile CBS 122367]
MKKSFLLSILVPLGFATADLVPALPARAPETDLQARSELNPLLGKRQFCSLGYEICFANDGTAICTYSDDICCQLQTGTDPFSCPPDHPYCCGLDLTTGLFWCGADATCSVSGFIEVTTGLEPTETTGVSGPTKKATAAPSATQNPTSESSNQPTEGNTPQPTAKTGAAVVMGTREDLVAVVVPAILVGMKVLL